LILWRLAAAHYNKLGKEYYNLWADEILKNAVKSSLEQQENGGDSAKFQSNCVNEIGIHLNYMAASVYIKYAFNATQRTAASELIENLFLGFGENLSKLSWMDEPTKQAAQRKLNEIVKIVGVPDWVTDPKQVDAYYSTLHFGKTTYFENAVAAHAFYEITPSQRQVGKPLDRKGLFFGIPWGLNAFHLTDYVQIQINPGILQRPLFSALNPSVMNYGSLGSVIGHEITHAFDATGYRISETGELKPWWTSTSTSNFEKGAKCFVDQYSSYSVQVDPNWETLKVNGATTLSENIADLGGINGALAAWRQSTHSKGNEASIENAKPDEFKGLTQLQVFFVAFAQTWCGIPNFAQNRYLVTSDPHAPNEVRVQGVVANSPDFAKAFGCPVGSPENPKDKCFLY
jgi:endothelin-converting enzyme